MEAALEAAATGTENEIESEIVTATATTVEATETGTAGTMTEGTAGGMEAAATATTATETAGGAMIGEGGTTGMTIPEAGEEEEEETATAVEDAVVIPGTANQTLLAPATLRARPRQKAPCPFQRGNAQRRLGTPREPALRASPPCRPR